MTNRFEKGKIYLVKSRCDRVYFEVTARTAKTATFKLIGRQEDANRFDPYKIEVAGNGETQKSAIRVEDNVEYGSVKVEVKTWNVDSEERVCIEAKDEVKIRVEAPEAEEQTANVENTAEANPADYAITDAAFREAVTGEVKAAYAAKLATEREEIMSTPLTTPEALDAAIEAETELANMKAKNSRKHYSINAPWAECDDPIKFNHVEIKTNPENGELSISSYFECKNLETAYRRFRKIMAQACRENPELEGWDELEPANKLTVCTGGYENENGDLVLFNSGSGSYCLQVDINEDLFYIYGKFPKAIEVANKEAVALEEYAISPEALDAAVEAETELASAAVQKKSATRAEILAELAEINADDSGISVDEEDIEWNRSYTEEELAEFERILLEEATESERAAYFAIKLESLKARQENARALADMAQEALRQAQAAVEAAENALLETNYAIDRLYRAEAERQVAKLEGLKVAGVKIISQNRVHSGEAVDNWGISTLYGKFSIFNTSSTGYIACGNYETPEQVTRVIEMLTAAVNAGKNEFTFPTLEELDKANFTFDAERFGQDNSVEDDGSNDDADEDNFTFNVTPIEDDDADDELIDPPEPQSDNNPYILEVIDKNGTHIFAVGYLDTIYRAGKKLAKGGNMVSWSLRDKKEIFTNESLQDWRQFQWEIETFLTSHG
ncbi:MAG: hypothetical protein IJQ82_11400 [Selenomonadaceae bacterium]|nr:hypothetical protein [Selenomonadaceae bacterium]